MFPAAGSGLVHLVGPSESRLLGPAWRETSERLGADPATLTLVKDGEHRLSRPQDLELLFGTLERMIDAVSPSGDRSQAGTQTTQL